MEKDRLLSLLDKMIRKLEEAQNGPIGIRIEKSSNILIDSCVIEGFPQAISAKDSNNIIVTNTAMKLPKESLAINLSFLRDIKNELEKGTPDKNKLVGIIRYFKDKVAPQILASVIANLMLLGLYPK